MSVIGSDLVTAFVIRELTGDKRTLSLRERALPYRPFSLAGTQRKTIDWYPGCPVGTMQVFGAREEPTTIIGYWKDAFLSSSSGGLRAAASLESEGETVVDGMQSSVFNNTDVITAMGLVQIVDDMRRKGQEIEVTWLNQVRRGIIDRFEARWHTGHDVEWEITFEWVSQGESMGDVKSLDDNASDLGDLPNRVQAELDGIIDSTAEIVPNSGDLAAQIFGALDFASAGLATLADQLTDAVVYVGSGLGTPNEALKRAAGILDGIKMSADDIVEIIEDYADAAALDSGAESLLNSIENTFGEVLAIRGENRERSQAAVRLRSLAAYEQHKLVNRITSTVISVFQAREDQDLREVAQKHYGTSDAWRGLMLYNNLTTSRLRAGQVVFVPAQPPNAEC